MSKKNILKIIGIILLIVIAIFVIHTIRNYIIITDLQNKIAKYTSNTNYSIKSISTSKEGTKVIIEYYKKENKQAIFMERNINGETLKVSMYDNGERIDVFTESSEGKSCDINSKVSIMQINLYNFLENDNKWQTLVSSAIASVKKTKYNEKECYTIKGFLSSTSLTEKNSEVIIEKETGLFLKSNAPEDTVEREYTFNNIEDSIFAEPDISQYKIKEK